jgi:hypothetical protein
MFQGKDSGVIQSGLELGLLMSLIRLLNPLKSSDHESTTGLWS